MTSTDSICQTCAGLIRLLGQCDYFPADPKLRELLTTWLHRVSNDHEHAMRIIDHWLATERESPKVADLVRVSVLDLRPAQVLPDGCELCKGEPWVVDAKGARRCVCARGRALAAA